MKEFLKVYLAGSSFLLDEELRQKALAKVSKQRKEAALAFVPRQAQANCLLAELLLAFALRQNGIDLQKQKICFGEYGKPYLEGYPLEYNLSHSGSLVALALSSKPVGIDIETRTNCDLQIAKYFHSAEAQALMEAEDKTKLFLRLWTGKEAYAKYLGLGLSLKLDSYDISPAAKGEAKTLSLFGERLTFHYAEVSGATLCLCSPLDEEPASEFVAIAQLL